MRSSSPTCSTILGIVQTFAKLLFRYLSFSFWNLSSSLDFSHLVWRDFLLEQPAVLTEVLSEVLSLKFSLKQFPWSFQQKLFIDHFLPKGYCILSIIELLEEPSLLICWQSRQFIYKVSLIVFDYLNHLNWFKTIQAEQRNGHFELFAESFEAVRWRVEDCLRMANRTLGSVDSTTRMTSHMACFNVSF